MNNSLMRGALQLALSVPVVLFFTICFEPRSGFAMLVTVIVSTILCVTMLEVDARRRESRLVRRIEAKDSPNWEVRLNDVSIGRITDAEYAAIELSAFRDGRNALAQLFNLGRMALAMVDKLVGVVPHVFFWSAAALVLFAPDRFTEVIHGFQQADAATTAKALDAIARVGFTLAVLTVGVMAALGCRFGFLNHYAEDVNRRLRQHCNTPAQGDVMLYRVAADGDVVVGGATVSAD
ncbi:hypothetical protein [Burkholderia ubonensis]|nr:hypothetical protein [Burkholderia ubonensis]